jgi:hypothetical protein
LPPCAGSQVEGFPCGASIKVQPESLNSMSFLVGRHF